jgi:hypothetical protein
MSGGAHQRDTEEDHEETDQQRLRRLWSLLLDRLLIEVVKDDVKASMLEVIRMFLQMNQVTAHRRADLRTGLEGLKALPFN